MICHKWLFFTNNQMMFSFFLLLLLDNKTLDVSFNHFQCHSNGSSTVKSSWWLHHENLEFWISVNECKCRMSVELVEKQMTEGSYWFNSWTNIWWCRWCIGWCSGCPNIWYSSCSCWWSQGMWRYQSSTEGEGELFS